MSKQNYYSKLFLNNLAELSEKDWTKQWIYIGGDTGRHLTKLKTKFGNEYKNFIPEHKNQCICTHVIEENCYIQNILNSSIVIVGNCCINRYLEQDTSKKCENCHQSHNNRIDNFCNECRGGIINFGKHKGKSFAWVKKHDTDYCDWVRSLDVLGGFDNFFTFLEENDYNDE